MQKQKQEQEIAKEKMAKEQAQEKLLLQNRQESSKKNFIDAFRSVKSIFSNTQPVHQYEEPVKSQSIFGGSMGLFTTPTDSANDYLSTGFGFGKTPFS